MTERLRSVKRLLEKGAEALMPKKVGDVWHKPEVSARLAARARKILLAEGKCVSLDVNPIPTPRHCRYYTFGMLGESENDALFFLHFQERPSRQHLRGAETRAFSCRG